MPAASSPPDQQALEALAATLQAGCIAAGRTVAVAESCTGGLVAHAITANAGSSAFFVGGVVSYSNAVKAALLGVSPSILDEHGAVSAQCAVAMADGARTRLGADLAASVTGVAGPDGGSDAKPVGLVYVAVAGLGATVVRRYLWAGDRSANKRDSAAAAIELLLAQVAASPHGGAA